MNILVQNPISLLASLSSTEIWFVIFCATTLGTLTILWVVVYVFFRPIPNHSIFAPLENMSKRFFNLGVVSASAVAGYLLSVLLKNYFQIGRPFLLNFGFHPLLTFNDYGFPSSHATTFAALATAVFLINRRAGVFAGLCALIIGAARIIAGVHTPLDIIGGYLLGIATSVTIAYVTERIAQGRVTR